MIVAAETEGAAPSRPSPSKRWPKPDPLVFTGLAGEVVMTIAPHSESDPIALLADTLVCFGNAAGRSVFRRVDGAEHHMNLFVALVGATAKGRKGSSRARGAQLWELVDPIWNQHRVQGGLASGEGLIYAVRDESRKQIPVHQKGQLTGDYKEVIDDPGIADKRLLPVESEFAAVLKVCERDKNVLSEVLRKSFDGGTLRTMTRNSPLCATGAHVSLLGHITCDELLRTLNTVEQANGFANRIAWLLVRRSKELPHGGDLHDSDLWDVAARLRSAFVEARRPKELYLSAEAKAIWEAVYHDLSGERAGLLGAITGRGEAQAMRFAMVYAALECSSLILPEHVAAALALWQYAEESAAYIFGNAVGDPDVDSILSALRSQPVGMTRTDINNFFARNLSAARIDRALSTLLALNLAVFRHEKTAGRPVERWMALAVQEQRASNYLTIAKQMMTEESEVA